MHLKHLLIAFLTSIIFFSCQTPPPTTIQGDKTPPQLGGPIVGNDSDSHGCKGSAGYQWSVLKKECIRIFETGIRLDPESASLDQTTSAFLVFASDTSENQAEIFLPRQKESLIFNLAKTDNPDDAGTWKYDTLTLIQWKGKYLLSDSKDNTLYGGHRN